jgi:hypothetical protein
MDFVRWLIGSIFTETVTTWARRSQEAHANRPKAGEPPPTVVQVGWLTKMAGPVVSARVTTLAALVWSSILVGRPIDGAWIAAFLFSAIAIWLGLGSYDAFFRRIDWNDAEVRFRKWNSDRTLVWDDIIGLQQKSYPPHVRINFRDGSGFAISETMNGSRQFLSIVERRLAPDDNEGGKRQRRRQRGKKRGI